MKAQKRERARRVPGSVAGSSVIGSGSSDLGKIKLPSITQTGAKKILDILEGKRLLTPPLVPPVVVKPEVQALEAHPLSVDQAKYLQTNLRRFRPKKKENVIDAKNDLFSRAIQNLPDAKQLALLQTLSKISKSLEFGGLLLKEDDSGVISTPTIQHTAKGLESFSALRSDAASLRSSFSQDGSGSVASLASLSEESRTHSLASSKSYGLVKTDPNHVEALAILDRIGHGMHLHPAQEQNYDLSGRGPTDLVPPTTLIARLHSEFKVHIGTAEVAVLMRKFDVDKRGIVDIVAILGHAKNVYAKTIYDDAMQEIARDTETQKKLISEKRAEHRAKAGSKELDGTEVEGTLKKDAMRSIIEKLSAAAYDAIRSRTLKPLNTCRPKISPFEFKSLLATLDCKLSARESFLLERRYFQGQTGTIDTATFRSEFIALGKDVIRDTRRSDAMQSFIRALSRVGTASTAVETVETSITAPTTPASDSIVGKKSVVSVEMAEEWLNDVLTTNFAAVRSSNSRAKAATAATVATAVTAGGINPTLDSPPFLPPTPSTKTEYLTQTPSSTDLLEESSVLSIEALEGSSSSRTGTATRPKSVKFSVREEVTNVTTSRLETSIDVRSGSRTELF